MSGAGAHSLIQARKHQGVQRFKPHQVAVALTLLCAGLAQAQNSQEATLGSVDVVAPAVSGVSQNLGAKVGAGALGQIAQKDAPYSSAVVTNEQILDQAPTKLGELFITDASVIDNSGAYTAWGSHMSVRGMVLDWENSYRIDGKPYLNYGMTLPYELFEQVELLKGASGFMYGFGSPGGLLNYVTKKPTDKPTRSVTLGYNSKSLLRASVDLGGRSGEDGALGYRLGVTREQGKAFNGGEVERTSASLALDAKLSSRLTWDFQAIVQDRLAQDIEPTIETSSFTGTVLPQTVKNDQRLVTKGDSTDNQFGYVATGLKYRINDDWQAQTNVSRSYAKMRRKESSLALLNSAGDYSTTLSDYGDRYEYSYWDAIVQGKVAAGTVKHNITAGVSWTEQRNSYTAWTSGVTYTTGASGNINQQNTNTAFNATAFDYTPSSQIEQQALFVSDRVELDAKWSVLGGLRMTNYKQTLGSPYEKSGVITPTLALMNKLSADTTAYVSYVESLEKGSIVPSASGSNNYSNAREVLNPLVSRQFELGVKKDGQTFSGTAALFRVERAAEYDLSCGTNCLTKVQDGLSVYQGLELGGVARLDRRWTAGGSLLLLDAEYVEGNNYGGNRVAGAPALVATSQVSYRVPTIQGLQVRLGAKYTGEAPVRAANDLYTSGYTLFNLGAVYDTKVQGYPTTFRASINNLTDKQYWMFQYANYVKPGESRSLNVSATVNF